MAEGDDDILIGLMEDVSQAMGEAAAELSADIKQTINTACNRKEHSPVGGPPYRETGTLQLSVGYDVTVTGPYTCEGSVGAGPAEAEDGYDYSYDIETGSGKMTGPRPFVFNRLEDFADLFEQKFSEQ